MVNKKLDNCEDSPVYNAAELFCDSEIDFATIEKAVKDILIVMRLNCFVIRKSTLRLLKRQ